MAVVTNNPPSAGSRDMAGIACVLIGMLLFVGQDALMKDLLGTHTIWLLMAVRGLVAVLVMIPVILILGGQHRLLTPLWPLHLARGALFGIGFAVFYTAFPFMGLAEVTTIFFAAPLIVALLAALWLGEKVGLHRMGCLIIGFIGVMIAMSPGGDTFQWVAVLPLISAVLYAVSQILARVIGDRETALTTGLHTIAFSSIVILILGWVLNQFVPTEDEFAHIGWHWPDLHTDNVLRLAALGLIGMGGYTLLSRAYQIAPASLVAPFDYVYLPMATVMAFILWQEVPGLNTMIGMILIIVSGLYLGYRELRHSRRVIEPAPTAEATFAPGNPNAALGLHSDGQERLGR